MPDASRDPVKGGLSDVINDLLRKKKEYETTTITCGFVGRSGAGKSSLINAVIGQRLARTGGHKQVTTGAVEYQHGGLHLVDLPGCGVPGFPTDKYVSQLSLGTYDLFIFATDLRFFDDDAIVFNQLVRELHKPCFLVRTKFDIVLQNAIYDGDNRTEGEIRQDIEADIRGGLPAHDIEKMYMVSARRPDLYDLPCLLDDLRKSFHGLKRLRLENDLAAWSKDALEIKRGNAMKITSWYAAASAMNGLNPLPGINVAVDLGILLKLANEVAHIYSLTHEQEDYWKGMLSGPHAAAIMQRVVALGAKYGTSEAILFVLRAIGKSEIPMEFARLIPFVGQLVSAGAGFGITYTFGKGLVDECHKTATDLLDELRGQDGSRLRL